MYSMLEKIDSYIKENGLPFREITFGYSYFDQYLDLAITNMVRKISGKHFNMGSLEYSLVYDDDGNLCLIAKSDNGRNTIVIYDERKTKNVKFPGNFYAFSESELIKDAAMLMHLEGAILRIRDKIYESNPNIGVIDRVKLEYSIMDKLIDKTVDMVEKNGDYKVSLDNYISLFATSTHNVLDYVEYLNSRYKEELIHTDEIVPENKLMNGICYKEPISEPLFRRKGDNTAGFSGYSKEKVYPVIPFDDRHKILEKLPYVYREYAYTNDKSEIKYINYLYNLGNNKYALIMEPYNGTGHTKIAIFNENCAMTRDRFIQLIKYYLELSYVDGLEENTLIRCNHTTLSTFSKIIDYAILGVNNGLTNICFMGKVKKLKNSTNEN